MPKPNSILAIAIYAILAITSVNLVSGMMTNTKLDVIDNRVDTIEKEVLRLEGRLDVLEEKIK